MSVHDIIVVSDLHLGRGKNPETGRYYRLEAFFYDEDFFRFCDFFLEQARREDRAVKLVLNGDAFDLLRVDHDPIADESLRERRYGPVVAIVCTSIVFWVAHFNHTNGVARFALLLGYGAAVGALTWAARSIWPAIVTHAFCDAVSFTTLASGFGPDWFMKKPAPFGETGVDGPFVVFSVLLIVSILAGVAVLRRLRLSTSSSSSSRAPGC